MVQKRDDKGKKSHTHKHNKQKTTHASSKQNLFFFLFIPSCKSCFHFARRWRVRENEIVVPQTAWKLILVQSIENETNSEFVVKWTMPNENVFFHWFWLSFYSHKLLLIQFYQKVFSNQLTLKWYARYLTFISCKCSFPDRGWTLCSPCIDQARHPIAPCSLVVHA